MGILPWLKSMAMVGGRWILEAVDEYGNSTVWNDHLETDQAALVA